MATVVGVDLDHGHSSDVDYHVVGSGTSDSKLCLQSHWGSGVKLTSARFVTGKSVAESDRLTLEQIKSTWNYQHGRMEGIKFREEFAEALREE